MRKMFPVKKGVFENAEISMGGNTELRRRSGLLIKELLFLKSRKSEIEKKADKIYKKQTLTGKVNRGYTNFSILEKACENYISNGYNVVCHEFAGFHEWNVWRRCAFEMLRLLFKW